MKTKIAFLISLSFLIVTACSSSEETTQNEQEKEEPEIYVFDDVTEPVDTVEQKVIEQPKVDPPTTTMYYVQVGAFTTKDRAEQFVKEKSSKTTYQLNITYSDEVRLFVIRLPGFAAKAEAEKVRNEFWQSGVFNDAFIVTQ